MTTKYITYGETAMTIATRIPTGSPTDGTWTVSVVDPDAGTVLVENESVTKYGGDTLAAAAKAGAKDIVLTTGTALKDGDLIAVGSGAEGWQVKEVARYIASTKTATLRTRLDEAVSSGVAVRGLDLSATIDASDWDDSVTRVAVYWEVDGQPDLQELYEVRYKRSALAGLEDEFRTAFQPLYSEIDPADFKQFESRARQRIKQEMSTKDRNFDLLVDSEAGRELWLTEIALLIGRSTGMDDTMWDRLEKDRQYQMAIIDNLPLWFDDNEDEVADETEEQPAQERQFMRGLI